MASAKCRLMTQHVEVNDLMPLNDKESGSGVGNRRVEGSSPSGGVAKFAWQVSSGLVDRGYSASPGLAGGDETGT